MMNNPWEKLPKQNNFYVLDADAPFINQFNESLSQNTKELFKDTILLKTGFPFTESL